ncbi:MAG TPA: hypothetical protein VK395_05390 [Gemmataceae bacterium]|nr:hypothetical protein [Gemmataceae bacterium]
MAGSSLLIRMFLTGLTLFTGSVSESDLLEKAEDAFRKGIESRDRPAESRPRFQEAAAGYGELGRQGAYSAELCRNQGNAYLLAGNLPRAILAYRRGLRLAPGDLNLRTHLDYARAQVAFAERGNFGRPPSDRLPASLPYFNPYLRLFLAVLAYALGWTGVFRWWMLRQGSILGMGTLAFALAGLLAITLVMEDWSHRQERSNPLVVIAEDGVLMRKGNGLAYPRRYDTPLHRGVEARLLVDRGKWLQIELARGEVGWVPRAYVLVDNP